MSSAMASELVAAGEGAFLTCSSRLPTPESEARVKQEVLHETAVRLQSHGPHPGRTPAEERHGDRDQCW